MNNFETEHTDVTYVTTDEPEIYMGAPETPTGDLLHMGLVVGGIESVSFDNEDSYILDGTVDDEIAHVLQRKFITQVSVSHTIVAQPSVGLTALLMGMTNADVRRMMGYVPRKPLFHKGRKPTW